MQRPLVAAFVSSLTGGSAFQWTCICFHLRDSWSFKCWTQCLHKHKILSLMECAAMTIHAYQNSWCLLPL